MLTLLALSILALSVAAIDDSAKISVDRILREHISAPRMLRMPVPVEWIVLMKGDDEEADRKPLQKQVSR